MWREQPTRAQRMDRSRERCVRRGADRMRGREASEMPAAVTTPSGSKRSQRMIHQERVLDFKKIPFCLLIILWANNY